MSDIILRYGDDARIASWVAEQLKLPAFEKYTAIGIMREQEIIGGWVYHDYRDYDIQISVATIDPAWLSRARLYALFAYPFIQLGVTRITANIVKENKRARQVAERLGFKHEGTMRKAYDGRKDAIIYGMLRRDCQFLGGDK